MQRKKQDGGFTATPFLPSTVQDTYHALKTLRNLKALCLKIEYESTTDKSLIKWLKEKKLEKEPKIFYFLIRIRQITGLIIDKSLVKKYIHTFKGVINLERYFYLAKLLEVAKTNLANLLRIKKNLNAI